MGLDCYCLSSGPVYPDVVEKRSIGTDRTDGRYADVTTFKCGRCNRRWLRYQFENEEISQSGRWTEALIAEATLIHINPENAEKFIEVQDWYIFGGSYHRAG
jgi:hypothetical protein